MAGVDLQSQKPVAARPRARTVDAVILYEHAARELDVACAIRALAARRHGLDVRIHQYPLDVDEALDAIRPRVLLLPYCCMAHHFYSWRRWALYNWRSAVHVNLAWEQFLYPGNAVAKSPSGEFAVETVIHHCWSPEFADHLASFGVPPHHLFLNGNPALQLYTEPCRRYYDQRDRLARDYGLDPEKPWLFFPENYGWAFYDESYIAWLVSRGTEQRHADEMRDYCLKSFAQTTAWLGELAARGEWEVVLRPRPFTQEGRYADAVAESLGRVPPGLHVTKGETVREWVLASNLVMSSYSTTLIEAAVAGRPTYMCEPYPLPECLRVPWQERLTHLGSREAFFAAVEGAGRAEPPPLGAWARERLLGSGDPIGDLVEFIARAARGQVSGGVPTERGILGPGRPFVPPRALFHYRHLRHRLARGGMPRPTDPSTWEGDVVDAAEIDARTDRWRALFESAARREPETPEHTDPRWGGMPVLASAVGQSPLVRVCGAYYRGWPIQRGRGLVSRALGRFLCMRLPDGSVCRITNPLELLQNTLLTTGLWEPCETAILQALVEPGAVVFDLGANIGYFTLIAASGVGPEGQVHAFEPEPRAFAQLTANLRLNGYGQVRANQMAVGDAEGTRDFWVSSSWNQGVHSLGRQPWTDRRTTVPVTTLDAYWESIGRPAVTLVKIDVEGAEELVLRGAHGLLQTPSPPALILELGNRQSAALGVTSRAVKAHLVNLDYALYELQPQGFVIPLRLEGEDEYGSVLALPRRAAEAWERLTFVPDGRWVPARPQAQELSAAR